MAYFDTRKTTGTTIGSIFDQLVKFIVVRISSTPKRPAKSPHDIVAAQHRAEAHRRAVDRLMR